MKTAHHFLIIFAIFGLLAGCAEDQTPLDQRNNRPTGDTHLRDAGFNGADITGSKTPCAAHVDCQPPEVCGVERGGDAIEMSCRNPGSDRGALGDICNSDAQCAANLCVDGQCATPCERPIDCSEDGSFRCEPTELSAGSGAAKTVNICRPRPPSECSSDADCSSGERCLAQKGSSTLTFMCAAPNGGAEVGGSCSSDADCAQNLCLEGVCSAPCASTGDCSAGQNFSCALTPVDLGAGHSASAQICTPARACNHKRECRVGEVCRIDRASGASFCDQPAGSGALGEVCARDGDCAENLCFEDRIRDICTQTCTADSDCPRQGYECKSPSVSDGSGGVHTMKICILKPPAPCTSNAQCGTGMSCAVVKNAAGNALERVCVPAVGKTNEKSCSTDADCQSLVCLDGTCSDPCAERAQCGAKQLCLENSVQKNGLSGRFKMCETPLDERCDQTGTCSDGVRACSQLYQVSDTPPRYEARCGIPNQSGASLGSACTESNQCHSDFCLTGISDDCSVSCTSDGSCGSGQVCAELLPASGGGWMGLCVSSCQNNSDCSGLNFQDAGEQVDHVCNISINQTRARVDQYCTRRRVTDEAGNTLGRLGADCTDSNGEGDNTLCQTGLCMSITSGGVTSHHCTRLCVNNGDCTGGASGNDLNTCSHDVAIDLSDLPGGSMETLSMCSR